MSSFYMVVIALAILVFVGTAPLPLMKAKGQGGDFMPLLCGLMVLVAGTLGYIQTVGVGMRLNAVHALQAQGYAEHEKQELARTLVALATQGSPSPQKLERRVLELLKTSPADKVGSDIRAEVQRAPLQADLERDAEIAAAIRNTKESQAIHKARYLQLQARYREASKPHSAGWWRLKLESDGSVTLPQFIPDWDSSAADIEVAGKAPAAAADAVVTAPKN